MRIPFATIPIATGRGLTTQRDYPQFQYLLDTVCLDPRPICMIAFTDARRFKAGGEMMKEGGIEIIPGFVIAEAELRERFSHSPGPGGQGVNTADSRVELMFDVRNSGAVPDQLRPIIMLALKNRLVNGVLTVAVHDQRSQLANRKLARARLVGLLQTACIQPRRRRATRRTSGSQRRRLEAKKRRGELKRNRQRPTW